MAVGRNKSCMEKSTADIVWCKGSSTGNHQYLIEILFPYSILMSFKTSCKLFLILMFVRAKYTNIQWLQLMSGMWWKTVGNNFM